MKPMMRLAPSGVGTASATIVAESLPRPELDSERVSASPLQTMAAWPMDMAEFLASSAVLRHVDIGEAASMRMTRPVVEQGLRTGAGTSAPPE